MWEGLKLNILLMAVDEFTNFLLGKRMAGWLVTPASESRDSIRNPSEAQKLHVAEEMPRDNHIVYN